MSEPFVDMLAAGGKSNSLGRAGEVVAIVLEDGSRLDELYGCLFAEDAWTRMRAADALEKVCREHPSWLEPYVDRFAEELATTEQASIRWHFAQILGQVDLTEEQRAFAIGWLESLLASADVDWIVAANAMETLARFTRDGALPRARMAGLLEIQRRHRSRAVVKRADRLLAELSSGLP